MRPVVVIFACASGCSLLLDSGASDDPDAGDILDTPDAALGCVESPLIVSAAADAEIVSTDQTAAKGLDAALALRGGANRTNALVRFDLPQQIDATTLTGLELRWRPMTAHNLCGGTCAACTGLMAGGVDLRFLTSAWVEDEVSWSRLESSSAWNPDAPDGLASSVVANAMFDGSAELALVIDSGTAQTEWDNWEEAREISFMLQPANDALNALFATLENTEGCDVSSTNFPPAELVVTTCVE